MKAIVRNGNSVFSTKFENYNYPDWSDESYIRGLEYRLLNVIYKQMNRTFVHVPTLQGFEVIKL